MSDTATPTPATTVTCKHCGDEFESKGKYQTHYRQQHQTSLRSGVQGTREGPVERDIQGRFICACSKGYTHYQSLQRHMKDCREGRDQMEEATSPQNVPEGTISLPA